MPRIYSSLVDDFHVIIQKGDDGGKGNSCQCQDVNVNK